MGQCGCADGFGHYKIRGLGGWIVLALYAGCESCDAPAAVTVTFYSDDSDLVDCIEDVEDVTATVTKRGQTGDFLALPVFNFHDLVESEEITDMEDPSEYETVKDLVSDMHYAIRQACVETINRTLQQSLKD